MTEADQIKALRASLESLVKLHWDWDKGTAYVTVKFKQRNDAEIKRARNVLAMTQPAEPASPEANAAAQHVTPEADIEHNRAMESEAGSSRVIDGVRVVDCPMSDEGDVYDWTQCEDSLRDGDVFLFANGTRAGILVKAWPTLVDGDAEHLHTLAGATWETLDGGKYAAAAAVAAKLVAR